MGATMFSGLAPRPLKDEWRTPRDLYATLDAEFHFAVDAACKSANCLAPSGLCVDQGRDGLLEDWPGTTWLNPPYSEGGIKKWTARAALQGRRVVVVMLVSAATDTLWWARNVASAASEVRFIIGRPRFLEPIGASEYKAAYRHKSTGSFGCAVVIYRPGHSGPPRHSYVDRSGNPLPGAGLW
jgi:phage N-6-adenine-methyltransferase